MKIDDVKSGEWVIVDLPCKVRVHKVTPVKGSFHKGNREVEYGDAIVLDYSGTYNVGSEVDITRADD